MYFNVPHVSSIIMDELISLSTRAKTKGCVHSIVRSVLCCLPLLFPLFCIHLLYIYHMLSFHFVLKQSYCYFLPRNLSLHIHVRRQYETNRIEKWIWITKPGHETLLAKELQNVGSIHVVSCFLLIVSFFCFIGHKLIDLRDTHTHTYIYITFSNKSSLLEKKWAGSIAK